MAAVGKGLLVLVGVAKDDTRADAQWLAVKVAGLRIFSDEQGRMNLAVAAVHGQVLAVSQFTLLADARKGRRPSFDGALRGAAAEHLFEAFVAALRDQGVRAETGVFGADMRVELVNDGPVTILLDSRKTF